MKMMTTTWLIIAAALILAGLALAVLGYTFIRQSDDSLTAYETKEYEIVEDFRDIFIDTKLFRVTVLPSEDGTVRVSCREKAVLTHSVTVENGVLTLSVVDTRTWKDRIGVNREESSVTLYLPERDYGALTVKNRTGSLTVKEGLVFASVSATQTTGNIACYASVEGALSLTTSTGSIQVSDVRAEEVTLTATTGGVTVSSLFCDSFSVRQSTGRAVLSDLECRVFSSKGNTGRAALARVIATESMTVERSTGDITLERCDGGEMYLTTDTGDVKGSLLSGKIFDVHTDTGRRAVPQSSGDGLCRIVTDTGNIEITLAP